MQKRIPGTLGKIREASTTRWIHSHGGRRQDRANPIEERYFNPGPREIREMPDSELATCIAEESGTTLGKLAEAEQRARENWQGPPVWSLIISGLALLVSLAAFIRAFSA